VAEADDSDHADADEYDTPNEPDPVPSVPTKNKNKNRISGVSNFLSRLTLSESGSSGLGASPPLSPSNKGLTSVCHTCNKMFIKCFNFLSENVF